MALIRYVNNSTHALCGSYVGSCSPRTLLNRQWQSPTQPRLWSILCRNCSKYTYKFIAEKNA